jgi:RNA polymerase sigma factor (sigma-70 family)
LRCEQPSGCVSSDELWRIGHDASTFEVFYRAHVEAIQRFIARRVDDPQLAADLTAEVFLAAIEAAASYREDRGTPTAWLFGIARIVVAAHGRRSARERHAVARIAGRRLLEHDDVARIQERIDAAAQARALYGALQGLTDGERAVFELVALDELSVADAAAALGIRNVTARVRLHRARATLRRQLSDDGSTADVELMEVSP